MALTLTFAIGTPCAGGNHFPVTLTPTAPRQPRLVHYALSDMLEPVNDDEIAIAGRVILRLYYTQLLALGRTPGQIKSAIQAKVLDLTVS